MFIDSFKNSRRFALQNSVYEDAGFIMNQLADQIQNSYIDYDEYYNQNVVVPGVIPRTNHAPTYGQNFGMYYSAFFNPGNDKANPADAEGRLGYSCNNGARNKPPRYVDELGVAKECIPIRDSLDRQTGQNPYTGKPGMNAASANAFCNGGLCNTLAMTVNELYLISPDAKQKTIFARERIGGNALANQGIWALSKVQLSGSDETGDGIIDSFKCAEGYSCGLAPDCDSAVAATYPRKNEDLQPTDPQFIQSCDNKENGFAHDFIPISPLRADVMSLSFKIAPVEDPAYAFAESETQREPQVTISLTVRPNPEMLQDKNAFAPFTLVRTVSALSSSPGVKAPVKVE